MQSSKIKPRVLSLGDIMTDLIVRPDGALNKGSDQRATIVAKPGGAGANPALWLAHFGTAASLCAKCGTADLAALAAHFERLGVTPEIAGDSKTQTGRLVTILDPDGERSFYTDRGANLTLDRTDLRKNVLDGIDLLHISGYALFEPRPRATARALIAEAKSAAIPISIDPASTAFLREIGPATFFDLTRGATYVFPNQAEAETLTGETKPENQLKVLRAHYPHPVLKRGADGAIATNEEGQTLAAPASPGRPIDTTGAGDAFLAGFIAARLSGASIADCLDRGNSAGALAIASLGGQPPERG